MKVILGVFPAWMRYFVQPFLVIYYVPLFLLRNLSSPSSRGNSSAAAKHKAFVASWKQAVETADEKSSYWPLHVGTDGEFEKDMSELDVNETILESMEVAAASSEVDTTTESSKSKKV